jgi:DNA-directed RNA polymerase I subunit RPA1
VLLPEIFFLTRSSPKQKTQNKNKTKTKRCETCALGYDGCPGHWGHIDLMSPVFNPVTFKRLLLLMKLKCFNCHKFRLHKSQVRLTSAVLDALAAGNLALVRDLYATQEAAAAGVKRRLQEARTSRRGIGGKASQKKKKTAVSSSSSDEDDDVEMGDEDTSTLGAEERSLQVSELERAEDELSELLGEPKTPSVEKSADTNLTQLRNAVIRDFFKAVTAAGKTCKNCEAPAVALKSDSKAKIFQKPLSTRGHGKNVRPSRTVFDALKELDRSSSSGADPVDESVLMTSADSLKRAPRDATSMLAPEAPSSSNRLRYLVPKEVQAHMKLLFHFEGEICGQLFGAVQRVGREPRRRVASSDMFFIEALPVPPSRFRPMGMVNGALQDNPLNVHYATCISVNRDLAILSKKSSSDRSRQDNELMMNSWGKLQEAVNCLVDSKHAPRNAQIPGISQVLEKKEGLFRRNMMGKRVNHSARTVLSPDPFLATHEVGLPLYFAMNLSFPEPVTSRNFEELARCVVNGPDKYPGALSITDDRGFTTDLKHLTEVQRIAEAKKLRLAHSQTDSREAAFTTKVVRRHLRNGDYVLMNRQPTLHKPSIMAHQAKVLKTEKTLRMHYTNCAQYNADFDGDEMNVHFPQDQISRAEAQEIAHANLQYVSPRDAGPIRGLIQDNVGAGVLLTKRDTFFEREDFMQLVYSALGEVNSDYPIKVPPPCVLRPQERWSGKQVVTTVIQHIAIEFEALNVDSKCKTPEAMWGEGSMEATLVVRDNELLCGVLDKSQFGSSPFGLVHAVYEMWGPMVSGQLLTTLCRLLVMHFQSRGFSCGIDDCMVTPDADQVRWKALADSVVVGKEVAAEFTERDVDDTAGIAKALPNLLAEGDREIARLDNLMKSKLQKVTSGIISNIIPGGQLKPFPENHLSVMTVTGAKGSVVNFSQISCLLGQQELEGKRVPRMPSGRTLPSFAPFDTSSRAGGFISQRFLTGIKPQEFYFHCMAGREGLVDTAVKTSRSGYLQRCIIKHLEGLHVQHDHTVRDADGSIYAFMYGDDGLDNNYTKYMPQLDFYANNFKALCARYSEGLTKQESTNVPSAERTVRGRTDRAVKKARRALLKARRKGKALPDPIISLLNPNYHIGSVAESFADALDDYCSSNKFEKSRAEDFKSAMYQKYYLSMVHPGEAVGLLAAQSIGEPSTQMTLNTFHLAGQGGANVTLGIPRLREIVMTASRDIATPSMTIPLKPIDGVVADRARCAEFAKRLYRLTLAELVDHISVFERFDTDMGVLQRSFRIQLHLVSRQEMYRNSKHNLTPSEFLRVLETRFLALFSRALESTLKNRGTAGEARAVGGQDVAEYADSEAPVNGSSKSAAPDDMGSEDARARSRKREAAEYEEDDDGAATGASDIEMAPPGGRVDVMEDSDDESADADSAMDARSDAQFSSTEKEAEREFNKSDRKQRMDNRRNFLRVADYKYLSKLNAFELEVNLPPTSAKILMLPLVEKVAENCIIKAVQGLAKSFLIEEDDAWCVQTEGVNFREMWESDEVDHARVQCNDIYHMLVTYGVEACRAHIVEQVTAVFSVYGIHIDPRHLGLVADYMTYEGGYRPFNRFGISSNPSPFQKMSFETTIQFVTEAALFAEDDTLKSPSSRIVLGQPVATGSGMCEILAPLQ